METRTIVLDVTFKAALIEGWEQLEIKCEPCAVTVRMGLQELRARTQHHVVSDLVAHLRCRVCGHAPSTVHLMRTYEDADPFQYLRFQVEEWTPDGLHVESIKAACYSVTTGWQAYHQAVKDLPGRYLTYRLGAWLFASTRPEPPPSPPSNVVPMPERKVPIGRNRARRRSRIAPF